MQGDERVPHSGGTGPHRVPPGASVGWHAQIARKLAAMEGAPDLEEVRRYLPNSLEWLARMALLEG